MYDDILVKFSAVPELQSFKDHPNGCEFNINAGSLTVHPLTMNFD